MDQDSDDENLVIGDRTLSTSIPNLTGWLVVRA